MRIVKAEVSASCKRGCLGYYEIDVWYTDTDINSRGIIENVEMSKLKNVANVKKGNGFAKIQKFFNTNEGKVWLEEELLNQIKE